MLHQLVILLSLAITLGSPFASSQPGTKPEKFPPHPDSFRKEGVPHGEVIMHTFAESKIFPGTTRDYWLYVPQQYTGEDPACLMVFQDGRRSWSDTSKIRTAAVLDNLIAAGELPITIGVFIDPGIIPARNPDREADLVNRQLEYDAVSDAYPRFLHEEFLPVALQGINVSEDPADRAIAGGSSGGIAAFNVAWERPDSFSRVFCWVGTFVGLRGGNEFAALVRKTEPKPIRVYLQACTKDLDSYNGSWEIANHDMIAALEFAGYETEHIWADCFHGAKYAGAIMPDALRWLWSTWPDLPQTHYDKSSHSDLSRTLIERADWRPIAIAEGDIDDIALSPDGQIYYSSAEISKIFRLKNLKRLPVKYGSTVAVKPRA